MKTDGDLQRKAVRWARASLWMTVGGIALVSIATPLVSARIFDKWFAWPNIMLLAPIPVMTGALIVATELTLRRLPMPGDRHCWVPFMMTAGIYILCFAGLAYSFYPYIVPERMTIVEAASAPEALIIMLVGALLVLPAIIGYTAFSYKVFHGKATDLRYD
jgi:cytochrome d ubiquinol oxidase subunit II